MSVVSEQRIGFVGMGNMGRYMATNLAAHLKTEGLPRLIIHNRTAARLLDPQEHHVEHAASPKALALQCDIVISSLANDDAARSVYAELFAGADEKEPKGHGFARENDVAHKGHRGTIFVESSTLYPTLSGEFERKASTLEHTYYLQCPVFGPPQMAKEGKLVWVLSGDYYAKKHVEKFLVPSMGRKVIDVGSNVERAAAFKLCGNSLILSIVETLAESLTLAEASGVGSDLLFEFIKEFIPAPSFVGYGKKILDNSFSDAGFTVEGGTKDANHIRHLAASVGVVVPLIDIAHRHLITATANGGGKLDWSALVAGPRLAAGLRPFEATPSLAKPSPQATGAKDDDEKPQPDGGIKELQNF